MSLLEDEKNRDITKAPNVLTRRNFLGVVGGAGLSLLGGGGFTVGAKGMWSSAEAFLEDVFVKPNKVREFNENLPQVSKEEQVIVENVIAQTKIEAQVLANNGESQKIPALLEQDQLTQAAAIKVKGEIIESVKRDDSSTFWTTRAFLDSLGFSGNGLVAVCSFVGSMMATVWAIESLEDIGNRLHERKALKQRPYLFHPEWQEVKPTDDELRQFYERVSLLPPVGGKIVLSKRKIRKLNPTWTAEEQVDWVLKHQKKLGKLYIHQLTVQGRAHDEFKYAALALIITSPYRHNWNEPFYEAPWGKIAPLVHDGGKVSMFLNPRWANIYGRTDFLQRIGFVYDGSKAGDKDLTFREATQVAIERAERERLLLEARAYQRLALVHHSTCLHQPPYSEMSLPLIKKLQRRWHYFVGSMETLLKEFGVGDVSRVTWFEAQVREWNSTWKYRHEANWEPIRESLTRLEDVRWQNPGLIRSVYLLLQEVTDNIDEDIGLRPQRLL